MRKTITAKHVGSDQMISVLAIRLAFMRCRRGMLRVREKKQLPLWIAF